MTITASGLAGKTVGDAVSSLARSVGSVTAGRWVAVCVTYWTETGVDPLVVGDLTKTAGTSTIGTIVLERQDNVAAGGAAYLHSAVFRVPVTGSGTLTVTLSNLASGSYVVLFSEEFSASGGWDTTTEAVNGNAVNTDSLTTFSSGNATSAGGALFVGSLIWNTSGSAGLTPQNSFTSIGVENDGNNHIPGAASYRIVTTGTTTAAAWNGSADGASYNGAAASVVVWKESASSGAMTGTSSASFGVGSSSLTGSGAFTAANAVAFGVGATSLRGIAAVGGTSALAFGSGSTSLLGSGALSGASAASFSNAGALLGSGTLTGAAGLTFGAAATLAGSGALTCTAALTFSTAGDLASLGSGEMSGTSALAFASSGTLAGAGALSGTASAAFSQSGALTASGALAGTAAAAFSLAGSLAGSGGLAGTSALAFTTAAQAAGAGAMSGTSAAAFSSTGDLQNGAAGAMSGTCSMTFGAGASTLVGPGLLSGISAFAFLSSGVMSGGEEEAERSLGFEMGGEPAKPKRRGLVTVIKDEPDQRQKITKRDIDRRVFEKAREEARALIANAAEQHATAPHAKAERFAQVRTALKPLSKALGDWNWIAVYQRMYQDALNEQIRQELAREDAIAAEARAAVEEDERRLMELIMEWM